MFRCWRWRRASRVVAGLLLGWAAPGFGAAGPSPVSVEERPVATDRLVLAAVVDGVTAPDPVIVRRANGRVRMQAADLGALGIRVATTGEVALDTVAGLGFAIDDAAQTIVLTQAAARRQRLRLAPAGAPAEPVSLTPNGWGAILNYDATASAAPRARTLAGLFDATLYTPHGFGFAGAIAAAGNRAAGRRLVRLETGYTVANPARLLRVTVGDVVNAAATFSRPVRMGGIKLGTDFGLRPDIVTFPIPAINGSAALPSAVDLIVNGNRRAAGEVRAGQFSVADVPVVTGVNTVTVAVRDPLGRQTLQTVTTYASRALLRRGLSAWSAEAGMIRTGFAGSDDRYRAFAASGGIRHGLTDRLTLEGHAEAGRAVAMAGAGATLSLGAVGLIDITAATSRSRGSGGGSGRQVAVGFERIGRPVSLSARYTRTGGGWVDLAGRYGATTRRHALVLNLGFDLRRAGSFGIGLIDLGRGAVPVAPPAPSRAGPADRIAPTTLVNASYSARLGGRINLVGNLGTDLRQRRSLFASLGLLVALGQRSSGYVGATARNAAIGGSAEYIRNVVTPGDLGYRFSAAGGAFDRVAAGLEYLGRPGHVDALVERTDGQVATRASARGALLLIDGGVYAANVTSNSFALVTTAGQAGVTVYRDHRPVGVTDRRGRLLVPNLNPYQTTRFAIDPTRIGNDTTVTVVERAVRPMERVGVPVRFDLAPVRAVQVRLIDEFGAPLAPGGRVLLGGRELPVGYDGLVYLDRIAPHNGIAVRLSEGRYCRAAFDRPATIGPGTIIGPIPCIRQQIATGDTRGGPPWDRGPTP